MLDFPSTPTVGQKYPASSIPGVPTYTWDGEKWTTIGGVIAGGGTISGDLTISKSQPTLTLDKKASGERALINATLNGLLRWSFTFSSGGAEAGGNAGSDWNLKRYDDAGNVLGTPLLITRADGHITLDQDPTAALHAATKQYVDARAAPAAATAAEWLANSAPTKMLTPGAVWSAAASVQIVDAATVTPNFALGVDFYWVLGAAGRTLANPINMKPGQKGIIYLLQDGTGGRTITSWGSAWRFPGATRPTLTASPGGVDILSYVCDNGGTSVFCTFQGTFG